MSTLLEAFHDLDGQGSKNCQLHRRLLRTYDVNLCFDQDPASADNFPQACWGEKLEMWHNCTIFKYITKKFVKFCLLYATHHGAEAKEPIPGAEDDILPMSHQKENRKKIS